MRPSVICMGAFAAATVTCYALSVHRRPYSSSSLPSNLVDMLPSDLDALENDRVIGALGVQLLLFGGWKKDGGTWQRDERNPPRTLQDRLERITPAWKSGGKVDYDYQAASGIFGDALSTGTTIAQLAETLQHDIGLQVGDFDAPARTALDKMLSWQIPGGHVLDKESPVVLLIFSFGEAADSCRALDDCPLGPGPTNQLLAATAAEFVKTQPQQQQVHMIAQWEVATALKQSHGLDAHVVGAPGTYQNTAEIFDLMQCTWSQLLDTTIPNALLLAHPDHLRRVLWTSRTMMKRRSHLRTTKCALPQPTRLFAAMQPYNLDWPRNKTSTTTREVNLFDSDEPTMVHTNGKDVSTNWYKDNLGFFSDGDDQKWTHQRQVWLLYDHWAVAKGIVAGTIDVLD